MDNRVRRLQTLGHEPGRRNWWEAARPLFDGDARKRPFVHGPDPQVCRPSRFARSGIHAARVAARCVGGEGRRRFRDNPIWQTCLSGSKIGGWRRACEDGTVGVGFTLRGIAARVGLRIMFWLADDGFPL